MACGYQAERLLLSKSVNGRAHQGAGREEKIRATVPHVRCEEWDMRKKGLFLQVTEEPLELTPEIRLQLKQSIAAGDL